MSPEIGVVDLFSGPGGLGEGFSAFEPGGTPAFSIKVSVEQEKSAHATLRLRSFLRKFRHDWPPEYVEFLNGRIPEPDWGQLYPDKWKQAEQEAWRMSLGTPEASAALDRRIEEIRDDFDDRTLLIGGPPCQAYSLAGRSRNAGNASYIPHKDERHFLYREYVRVLDRLEPAVFVMENVKGMLSSAVKGDSIFHQVMADLRGAGSRGGYHLHALCTTEGRKGGQKSALLPSDFIVRAEEHGIPQARHRVIIVGIRSDVASRLPSNFEFGLVPRKKRLSTGEALAGLPALRSGLSRGDSAEKWRETVLDQSSKVCKALGDTPLEAEISREVTRCCKAWLSFSHEEIPPREGGAMSTDTCPNPAPLDQWLRNPLVRIPANHSTRGHMDSDLGRYLFVSAFGKVAGRSPKASEFPADLKPNHRNWESGKFADRFRTQIRDRPATTVTSHISKDGHYFIHPDPLQCRSLTVREAARIQTFPDDYYFLGNRTSQYVQVGNAVPPFLAYQIAEVIWSVFESSGLVSQGNPNRERPSSKAV